MKIEYCGFGIFVFCSMAKDRDPLSINGNA